MVSFSQKKIASKFHLKRCKSLQGIREGWGMTDGPCLQSRKWKKGFRICQWLLINLCIYIYNLSLYDLFDLSCCTLFYSFEVMIDVATFACNCAMQQNFFPQTFVRLPSSCSRRFKWLTESLLKHIYLLLVVCKKSVCSLANEKSE